MWFCKNPKRKTNYGDGVPTHRGHSTQRAGGVCGGPTSGWHSVPPCTSWVAGPSSRPWGSCCSGCSLICSETSPHLSESSLSCSPGWKSGALPTEKTNKQKNTHHTHPSTLAIYTEFYWSITLSLSYFLNLLSLWHRPDSSLDWQRSNTCSVTMTVGRQLWLIP